MSLTDVTALTDRLEEHCRAYALGPLGQPPQAKGFARLFRRWISYNDQAIEPVHKEFLDGTEALIRSLTEALAGLSPEEAEAGRAEAERAVAVMLAEKPAGISNERRLYLTAAESLCAPLLPLLSQEALARRRDGMLAVTPKRLMFPKQLDLLKEMETLLDAVKQ